MTFEPLYTAVATAKSGRDGHVHSSDNVIDIDTSVPKSMGGPGKAGATNPEQLFACGYSACFAGAMKFVASQQKLQIKDPEVTAHVTFGKVSDGFGLAVELQAHVPDLDHAQTEKLVHEAHQFCPYSRATRNNIEVKLSVI